MTDPAESSWHVDGVLAAQFLIGGWDLDVKVDEVDLRQKVEDVAAGVRSRLAVICFVGLGSGLLTLRGVAKRAAVCSAEAII